MEKETSKFCVELVQVFPDSKSEYSQRQRAAKHNRSRAPKVIAGEIEVPVVADVPCELEELDASVELLVSVDPGALVEVVFVVELVELLFVIRNAFHDDPSPGGVKHFPVLISVLISPAQVSFQYS
ncbi:hypothetical protein PI124_g11374 [Phytophthora idaei]|nr:hypothetical protein PI125_g9660 [Phytophthora idaei]KAG3153304.1 hypothetical protein PI126_g10124 [Phytophthora idaei]KAG3243805.1 hypothetical protein PI124_g11374 [Phytophthora idaei]